MTDKIKYIRRDIQVTTKTEIVVSNLHTNTKNNITGIIDKLIKEYHKKPKFLPLEFLLL